MENLNINNTTEQLALADIKTYLEDTITYKAELDSCDIKTGFKWLISLTPKNNETYIRTFDYSEGIGCVINQSYWNKVITAKLLEELNEKKKMYNSPHSTPKLIIKKERLTKFQSTNYLTIKAPDLVSIMYCLISDSEALNYDFNEWCNNYGYDTDSIKANNIYKGCIDNAIKLNQLGINVGKLQELYFIANY